MFNENLMSLPKIGKQRLLYFNRLGIHTKRDLLFLLPNKYMVISTELREGELAIKVKIKKKLMFSKKFFRIIGLFGDIEINLNFYNVRFFNIFYINQFYYIYGKLYCRDNQYYIDSPSLLNNPGAIVPMYKGVPSYLFSNIIFSLIDTLDDSEIICEGYTLKKIFLNLHTGVDVKNSMKALKYLEASFLLYLFDKDYEDHSVNVSLASSITDVSYNLSASQLELCEKIEQKLKEKKALKYFVYGEVGSGKTIISITSMLMVVKAGYTVVLLAPTITLAYQHYLEILKTMPAMRDQIVLFTSACKKQKQVKKNIENNVYRIIIGTHSLLFLERIPNLALVIIDEIHKFGVLQRSNLVNHAIRKNILMLTATPIPRSLSMMISRIMEYYELPSFKDKKIQTIWVKEDKLDAVLQKFSQKKLYWILPNIEPTESRFGLERRFQKLSSEFSGKVYMLHGKMKDSEKIENIEKFKNSKTAVLVATTIVEIGINVPDADVIVIENADSFGLSQLHQLRGRVGRMGQQSFCILSSKTKSKKIQYMRDYSSGFDISQKDLELRGGGKITGVMQHGVGSFYFLTEDDDDIFELALQDKKRFKAFEIFASRDISC